MPKCSFEAANTSKMREHIQKDHQIHDIKISSANPSSNKPLHRLPITTPLPIGHLSKDPSPRQASPLQVLSMSPPAASDLTTQKVRISTSRTFLAPSNSLPIRSSSPDFPQQSKLPIPNGVSSSPVVPVIAAESEQESNVNYLPTSPCDTRHPFAPPSSPLFTPPSSSPPSPLIASDRHPCDRSHASHEAPSAKTNARISALQNKSDRSHTSHKAPPAKTNARISAPQNKSGPPEKSNDNNAPALRQSRRQTRRRPAPEEVSSSQEDEAIEPVDVDDDKEDIHGLSYISTAMEKVGLIVLSPRWLEGHKTPLLLACRACQKGINIQNGVVHATRKELGGHGLKASKDIVIELEKWIKLRVHLFLSSETAFQDAPSPPLMTKPLPILKVYDGLRCTFKNCDYTCKRPNAMATHWSEKHRHKKAAKKAKDVKVQTFFKSHPRYFVVSQVSGSHANSRYELYLTQLVPDLEKNCHEVVPYLASEREIPPLLKVMQWHEHLSPYLLDDAETNESSSKDRPRSSQNLSLFSLPKVQSLKTIVDQPKCPHLRQALGDVVDAYLFEIKRKGQPCEPRIRRMLQEYPIK